MRKREAVSVERRGDGRVPARLEDAEEDGHGKSDGPDEEEGDVAETPREERHALEEERERRDREKGGECDDEDVREEDQRLERRLGVDDLNGHDDGRERESHDREDPEVPEELAEDVFAVRHRGGTVEPAGTGPPVERHRVRYRVEAEQADEDGEEPRGRHRERGRVVDGPATADRQDSLPRRRVGKGRRSGRQQEAEEDERRRPPEPG